MTNLTTIPSELQTAINSFFSTISLENAESELFAMLTAFISHPAFCSPIQNDDCAFTYRSLINLLKTLQNYERQEK